MTALAKNDGRGDLGMARKPRNKANQSWGRRILGLALINFIPLAGLGALAWALTTERLAMQDLPPGVGRPALGFVVALLLLIVVVSALLPLSHGWVKALWRQLQASPVRRAAGGAGRKLFEFLMWPFRRVFHLLFWLTRLLSYLLSFGLILACCLFLIRTIKPEFLQEWLPLENWGEQGMDWLRHRF